MCKKYKDGEITWNEYYDYLKSKPKSMHNKYKDREITSKEYLNWLAQKQGFKNRNERESDYNHRKGKCKPMSENKDCSYYLGIHIAERILSKVFNNVRRMKSNNIGYDFICNKGYKIDVKSACLIRRQYRNFHRWYFNINKNKIANYFLLIAFDNREDLNPKHIWLIKGINIINRTQLNKKTSISINNTTNSLKKFSKFEINDKLRKLKKCCIYIRCTL